MFNKRVIMVEGCDRTGKSTFISLLVDKIKSKNKIPLVLRLLGPLQMDNISFNNNEKSLLQLAKYNNAYENIIEILNQNPNIIIILDRCHFGEFVWSNYWNRNGQYITCIIHDLTNKFNNLFKQSIYINYYISNIDLLEQRIKESPEDEKIFTINNLSIKENINNVYNLYNELNTYIKSLNIEFIEYDNSYSLDKVNTFIDFIFQKLN